ncbi:MAG: hypothetical protein J7L23_01195 [Candidatus Diapherotrites archaeon]|nr:hypothetical protein [Candidatus Diapherotrites archaeon]
MVEENLIKWARQRVNKGFSKEQITQELKKAGYSDKEIAHALTSLETQVGDSKQENLGFMRQHITGIALLLVIILLIVGIVIIYKQVEERIRDITTPVNPLSKIIKEEVRSLEEEGTPASTREVVLIPGDLFDAKSISDAVGAPVALCFANESLPACAIEADPCPDEFCFKAGGYFSRVNESAISVMREVHGELKVTRVCGLVFVGFKPTDQ